MKKKLFIALALLVATGTMAVFAQPYWMNDTQTGEEITISGTVLFDEDGQAVLSANGTQYTLMNHQALVRRFGLKENASVTVQGSLVEINCACDEDHGPVVAVKALTVDGKTYDVEDTRGSSRRGGRGGMRGGMGGSRGFFER